MKLLIIQKYDLQIIVTSCYNILSYQKKCSKGICLKRHKSIHLLHLFASLLLLKVMCLFKMFIGLASSDFVCFCKCVFTLSGFDLTARISRF